MLYDKTFPGMYLTSLLTLDKEAMTVQCAYNTKARFDGSMSFIGVIYRDMDEELYTGAEITKREFNY